MSYPNVIYGDYGGEKVTQSTKIGSLPLGTQMILPDGRKFRHSKASATALVAGKFYQQHAGIQGTDADYKASLATVSGGVAGSTSIDVTAGGTTAVTKDQFADGYLAMAGSVGTGIGLTYKIKECSSAAVSSSITVTLEPTDPFKVAIAAATTVVGLRENEYLNLTITTADTVGVGSLAGIAPVAVSANHYCWIQRGGPVMALTDGTLIVGQPCAVSNAIAGAVKPIPTAAADTAGVRVVKEMVAVGYVMSVAASTGYSLINLALE